MIPDLLEKNVENRVANCFKPCLQEDLKKDRRVLGSIRATCFYRGRRTKGETLSGAFVLLLFMQDNSVRDEEALCSRGDQYLGAKRTSRTPFLSPKSSDVTSETPFDPARRRGRCRTRVLTRTPRDPACRAKPRTNPSSSFFFPPQIRPGSAEQRGHREAKARTCDCVRV